MDENAASAVEYSSDSEQILRELFRRARDASTRDALDLALSLPQEVQAAPYVAIEIAKFARELGEVEIMLRHGGTAHKGMPGSAPIANTYAEFLSQERRYVDAVAALIDTFCTSLDSGVATHLRMAVRGIQARDLPDGEKTALNQATMRLAAVLTKDAETHHPVILQACIESHGLVGAVRQNVVLMRKALAPIAAERGVADLLEAARFQQLFARSDFADLLSAIPEAVPLLFAHAIALDSAGELPEAIAILNALVEQPDIEEEVFLWAAKLALKAGAGTEIFKLDLGLRRFPQSIFIARALIDAAAAAGDYEHARAVAEKLYQAHPHDDDCGLMLVRILIWDKSFDQAFSLAQTLLERRGDFAALFEAAAYAARGVNRIGLAYEYTQKALALEPESKAIQGLYVECALSLGDVEALMGTGSFHLHGADAMVAERAGRLMVALIQSKMPNYVDDRHVQLLRTLVDAHLPAFDVDLLWEIARLGEQLGMYDFAGNVMAVAIDRTDMLANELPPNAERMIDHIFPAKLSSRSPLGRQSSGRDLVSVGLAAAATSSPRRAAMAFYLAAALAPNDPAATINAAFAALGQGWITRAWKLFEPVSRVYKEDMDHVMWPAPNPRRVWPLDPIAYGEAFETLKPVGAAWPLITVITPSYNQGKYLEETILSVLNQGYPNLQYIVVDGLSEDESIEVIRKYEHRLATVIIEEDSGQTEAINKGLKLAKGDIITWINSDDMLAPGALYVVALTWLRSKADLIYGICFAHKQYHFEIANLPAADAETFTLQHLGQIFKYWLRGFFFYQPEVFFSRRILDAAGGLLDESLFYVMDYKFWLQCARNQARIERVHWPMAFFRQHAEQKTANLAECIFEQAELRDRFVRIEPPATRQLQVREKLRTALAKPVVRIGLVSSRLSRLFSPRSAEHLAEEFSQMKFRVDFVDNAAKLKEPDLVVKLVHLQGDVEEIQALRSSGYKGAVLGWFWDNHHHVFDNFAVSEELDVVLPGHAFASSYLRNRRAIHGASLPLCAGQWTTREAEELYQQMTGLKRLDPLYGGFVRYTFAKKRNDLLEALISRGHGGITFIEDSNSAKYFSLPPHVRFEEWMSHKTSICLPLRGDLSLRLFDALLTGQIPIVPSDVYDLDAVVPPALQATLPIVRFDRYEAKEVEAAYQLALRHFDRDGEEGVVRRHRFAMEGHMLSSRVREIIAITQSLASSL